MKLPPRGALAALAFAVALAGLAAVYMRTMTADTGTTGADASDAELVALGRTVYAAHCATCHGARLEGEPDWRSRRPDGSLPAPPHDETGHTWHHPDRVLFEVTRDGGARNAPPGFRSTMPAFGDKLSDREIWAALAYIKSRWPEQVRRRQERLNERAERAR